MARRDPWNGDSPERCAQFDKPKGARVGSDRYVEITLAQQTASVDFVTTFPGGTLHAHQGEHEVGSKPELPVR